MHVTNITHDILGYKEEYNSFLKFRVEFSFLKIPAIRRINLSHRTRNAASQRYTRAKRGMKLNRVDGIEIKNIEMLRLTPIELHHSIIMWKSITVHSKLLLLDQ